MNIKLISRYVGIALLFNAFFMLVSLGVSAIYGFDESFSPLLLSTLITFMVGIFPLIFVGKEGVLSSNEGFVITFFSWLLSFIFGMLPYVLYGGPFSLANAWFESVSGYTTTGSTILSEIESLPKGLLFWRYSTHFIGGIGVMVFMLMVLPTMSAFRLRKIEFSSLSKNNYQYRTRQILTVVAYTYIGITIASAVSLLLAGMPLFDAVGHAMTIVATGGFSNMNASIAAYDSVAIEIVCIFFMYVASLHFGLLYALVAKRSTALFKSPVFRYYTLFVIAASLIAAADLRINGNIPSWGEAVRHSFFNVVSMITTTGLASADVNDWSLVAQLIIMTVVFHGACSGSTSGGIKADRMWLFFLAMKRQISKLIHPNAVISVKMGHALVDDVMVSNAMLYIVVTLFITIVASLLLAMMGIGFSESVTASISSIANAGPGIGSCGTMGNFGSFPAMGKFLLTLEMFMGRIEIFSLLVLFQLFRRK